MTAALVTGASGLIGSQAVRQLAARGFRVIGIDNDLRGYFFGPQASTSRVRIDLERHVPGYRHEAIDIRDAERVDLIFAETAGEIELVIHAAAQPSHDWAAREPVTDFTINANGTLNLLEATRRHAPEATFIFLSTNKVYGDAPNELSLIELERRYDVAPGHPWYLGIDEFLRIDQSTHSLFGVSKTAGDLMVQEYGRYFGMKTGCFRCGCLTGPAHAGAELHGFLAYLMRCAVKGINYSVFGYKGKQVRDNIHSFDAVSALLAFHAEPRSGEVYNLGGGRECSCSVLEAIDLCQEISGRKLDWKYVHRNRIGDHVWWITNNRKFETHYPNWRKRYDLGGTLREIRDSLAEH
jgi:CDP-paratose 2-epimerase